MMRDEFRRPKNWAFLPDLLLEEIFSQLPIKNLGRCSQVNIFAFFIIISFEKNLKSMFFWVCLNWYRISQNDYVWHRFQYKDYIFTRRKYTSHGGWQYMIDHWKLRFLILNATMKWKKLEIEPVTILFNLYEFIRVLTNFSEYYERNLSGKPLQGIRSFSFKWQLHVHEGSDHRSERVFGTGGEMLKTLSMLLSHLHGLTELTLRELQLEPHECANFIDDILYKFDSQMTSLCIVNLTKVSKAFLQLGLFLCLVRLTVSPQHLDESVIQLLADLKYLKSLIIFQNEKTFDARAVNSKAWISFQERNNYTKIYLIQAALLTPGKRQNTLLIQPKAPVYAIIFENSTGQLTSGLLEEVICSNYSTTLCYFLQKGLERRYRSRKFAKRVDILVLELARRCSNLKLLAIRERMSFASVLLLAQIAQTRQMAICLRRNALLKRINWTNDKIRNILGFECDQKWIKRHCRSLEILEKTVQDITGTTASIVTDNRYLHSF
ncbi:unnamed protein product [Thelazia callipaeda]|uniref:F-box domain-containing protein n=1 Tax=Thelazia callipaeda TaxID=103827 RepID=A0A0N5D955_THECL|nr:unnamed protein product [Thelazia callipaeda]